MKKIILIGILLSFISLLGCKKEAENGNLSASKKLVGTWLLEKTSEERPTGAPEDFENNSFSYEFQASGKVLIKKDDLLVDTDDWQVLDEGKLMHYESNPEVYEVIEKLGAGELIYHHLFYNNGQYNLIRYYFKRKN